MNISHAPSQIDDDDKSSCMFNYFKKDTLVNKQQTNTWCHDNKKAKNDSFKKNDHIDICIDHHEDSNDHNNSICYLYFMRNNCIIGNDTKFDSSTFVTGNQQLHLLILDRLIIIWFVMFCLWLRKS